MNFKKVLFLGAHPDDEVACAGTLHRLIREGADVEALTFSDLGNQQLRDEYARSMDILGIRDRLLLDLPVRHLADHSQDILEVMVGRRDQYDLVLAPASSDCHQDHQVINSEAIRAFKHTTLLGYEHIQNAVMEPFHASTYVKLGYEDAYAKRKVGEVYKSQAHRTYMDAVVLDSILSIRGVQAGVESAEAFETVRMML